jgi:hypothetical protein
MLHNRVTSFIARRQKGTGLWLLNSTEAVVEARERALGKEGVNRYSGLDQRQEALQISEKTGRSEEEELGEEHPDTLRSMYNQVANRYSKVGQWREALQLREKVVALVSTSPSHSSSTTTTSTTYRGGSTPATTVFDSFTDESRSLLRVKGSYLLPLTPQTSTY